MKHQSQSNQANGQPPGGGIGLDDIYFTAFRHKKILLACFFLGIIGALVVRYTTKPLYSSEAKLLVRYVIQTAEIDPSKVDGGSVVAPDAAGNSIMNTESELLRSQDLATNVAALVGPETLLAASGGGSDLMAAAGVVSAGVVAYSPPRSDVMTVAFYHPDSSVVQPVLSTLIEQYKRKNFEVHMKLVLSEEYYTQELAEQRKKLEATEEELKDLLRGAQVLDAAAAKKNFVEQVQKLQNDLLSAKTELSEKRSGLMPKDGEGDGGAPVVPNEKVDEYASLLLRVQELRKSERELLTKDGLTEEHPRVTGVRDQIAQLATRKAALERDYPPLLDMAILPGTSDPLAQRAEVQLLEARVKSLEEQLNNVQTKGYELMSLEPKIMEVSRRREQQARQYDYLLRSLEKARSDEGGGNKVTGIRTIQEPTPAHSNNRQMLKRMVMIVGGFFGLGIGLAVLLDFVIDRTIKRPVDVRRHMHVPVFLSIPDTCWGRRARLALTNGKSRNGNSPNRTNDEAVTMPTPPWDPDHHLRLYSEGLRERLITHFEVNGINHKPKLVGVTSCGERSGVTTLASGVAAALSKTGDGNVLLIDMNGDQSSTHSFYKGKPGVGLADALAPESRADMQVQENLYLVSLHPSDTPGAGCSESANRMLPSRFNKIMPELKASDYDYIIFDMPPVTPTSVSPRLSSHMDMVLLVLESEKTGQQTAHQASVLLAEARANAAVVLNKCRRYVPKLLSQEM